MTTKDNHEAQGKRRRRRAFGAVRQLPSGRWQARYRNRQGRLVPAPRTFPTKTDATKYLTLMEAEQIRGSHYDPKRGQTKFGVWADQWLKGATLRPKTRTLYGYLLRRFIKPTFADIALNDIDDTLAADWLAELRELPDISETTIAKAYRLFARIMGQAVESRYIVHTNLEGEGRRPRALARDALRHARAGQPARLEGAGAPPRADPGRRLRRAALGRAG